MDLPLYRPPVTPDDATDFDYEEFRRQIEANGHVFYWQWGVPCPCQGIYTVGAGGYQHKPRSPRVTCEGCKRTPGVLYLPGQRSAGIVAGFGDRRDATQYLGILQPGEVLVTLPPEHSPDHEDIFTDLSVTRPHAELIRREPGTTILRPRYPIIERLMRLGYSDDPAEPDDRSIGLLYATKGTAAGVYVPGALTIPEHFTLTDEGELDCTPGIGNGGPDEGEWVSIRYNAHPSYKMKEIVRQGRDKTVTLRAFDGCEVVEVGLGPVHVILAPRYRGFRDVDPYKAELD